jgi:hypothetical protein
MIRSRLQFGSLNHVWGYTIDPQGLIVANANALICFRFRGTADMAGPVDGGAR